MSTTWYVNYSFLWIFMVRHERSGPDRGVGLFQHPNPSARQTNFRVCVLLKRKDNSSRGSCQRLHTQLRCREESIPKFRNFNRIPFWLRFEKSNSFTELPYALGSTNPLPTTVPTEPFPTSVFKVLIWIFATSTKICTRGRSTQVHTKGFVTTPTPAYSFAHNQRKRQSIGNTLERHPFSGLVHSAGELLHTP